MNEDRKVMPGEAARRIGVTTKTLGRWAAQRRIGHTKTASGQHRYPESEVRRLEAIRHPEAAQ
jgi:excisionase family DNA binding protein